VRFFIRPKGAEERKVGALCQKKCDQMEVLTAFENKKRVKGASLFKTGV
jgi:hypothetical protein